MTRDRAIDPTPGIKQSTLTIGLAVLLVALFVIVGRCLIGIVRIPALSD